MTYKDVISDLKKHSDSKRAAFLPYFFKTGKGQYGEGDVFWGISVPDQRAVAKKYTELSLVDIQTLLLSKVHEHRSTALLILVKKFQESEGIQKEEIYNFYLKNTERVNNWDLVDTSAPYIVGEFLKDKNREILYKLAKSPNLWEKRISVISTFALIKVKDFTDTLKISKILLPDKHDLIHKAVGWMLREVGKKDLLVLEEFLQQNYKAMPRTALRYSIEKLENKRRLAYLKGEI